MIKWISAAWCLFVCVNRTQRKIPTNKVHPQYAIRTLIHTYILYTETKEVNKEESCIFLINLRHDYGLHVRHFSISVSCLGLNIAFVSTPRSLGLVLVALHSGLDYDYDYVSV